MPIFGPLFRIELARLARRGRQPRLRAAFAALLLGALFLTYVQSFPYRRPLLLVVDPDVRMGTADAANFGERFLAYFLIVQLVVVVVITPVFAGGAIADEKNRQTLDFLLASPLTSLEIVLGKMAARLVFVGGVILTGLPVLAITTLFGGVDVAKLLAGYAISGLTMLSLGALSLYLAVVSDSLGSKLWRAYALTGGLTVLGFCGGCFYFPALVSPFPTLMYILDSSSLLPNLSKSTERMVIGYAIVHLLATAWFLLMAAEQLRPRWLHYPGPKPALPLIRARREDDLPPLPWLWGELDEEVPSPTRQRHVPQLRDGEGPLYWKEVWFTVRLWSIHWTQLPANFIGKVSGCGCLLIMCMFMVAAGNMAHASLYDELFVILARLSFGLLVPGFVLLLGTLAARSVTVERQRRTLDCLLGLPGDRSEVLRAKARAAMRAVRPFVYLPAVFLVLAVLIEGAPILSLVMAPLLVVGWGAFALGLGMWLSCQCLSSAQATAYLLLVAGLVCLVPPLLSPIVTASGLLSHGSEEWVEAIGMGLSPITGTWTALLITEYPRWPLPDHKPFVGAVVGAILAGVTGLGFWRAAGRRFARPQENE